MKKAKINMKPRSTLISRLLAIFALFWIFILAIGTIYFFITRYIQLKFNFWDYTGIPMVFFSFVVAYFFMFYQESTYAKLSEKFVYSFKMKDFIYKREPYGIIRYNKIKKVEKITNQFGTPLFLKVYEKDRVHYLSSKKIVTTFLYELKKRELTDVVKEKKREKSWLGVWLLKTKGGKMEAPRK